MALTEVLPQGWRPMDSAPKDGSLLDVRFATHDAEPGMAEYYVPGCTRKRNPPEPVISNVAYACGVFKPVVDAAGVREMAALRGGWGEVKGAAYGILSVTLTGWRPAVAPPQE